MDTKSKKRDKRKRKHATILKNKHKPYFSEIYRFEAIDWALQKRGLYIVFLTRLSPLMPFPLLNYAFGATRVKENKKKKKTNRN